MSNCSKGFMTPDGRYYQSEVPLAGDHIEVPLKPTDGEYFYSNGRWHPDRRTQRTPEEVWEQYGKHRNQPRPAPQQPPSHNMEHRPYDPRDMEQQMPQHQMPPGRPYDQSLPPPQPVPGVNVPYTINQDSQFNFKLKDVVIIAGAIASAAVSWNNADGRISRLEEKVSQEMVKKIESIERKQDELVKKQDDSIRALTSQISDLERAVLNAARNAKPQ